MSRWGIYVQASGEADSSALSAIMMVCLDSPVTEASGVMCSAGFFGLELALPLMGIGWLSDQANRFCAFYGGW